MRSLEGTTATPEDIVEVGLSTCCTISEGAAECKNPANSAATAEVEGRGIIAPYTGKTPTTDGKGTVREGVKEVKLACTSAVKFYQ
jgi:hypothetical protein